MDATIEMATRTVGELASNQPTTIPVFEDWKIDYCCGGRTPLAEACEMAGHTVAEFLAAVDAVAILPDAGSIDWNAAPLANVSNDIVSMYHDYTREALQTVSPLVRKVLSVHGNRRPELAEVVVLIGEIAADILPHMLKEEQVLFPYIMQLEEASAGKRKAVTPFFGTVKNPVRMMMLEHDRVGALLVRLRAVTNDYTPPESACFSYKELYRRLSELEQLTHQHIHVENNVLFPRAVRLEEQIGNATTDGSDSTACLAGCGA